MSGGTRASAVGALIEPSFHYRDGRIVTERGRGRCTSSASASARSRGSPSARRRRSRCLAPSRTCVTSRSTWAGSPGRAGRCRRSLAGRSGVCEGARRHHADGCRRRAFVEDVGQRARRGCLVRHRLTVRGRGPLRVRRGAHAVRAEGVNGYTFTGEALAWAAERIAAGDSDGAGALGPPEAFGLEALEAGVAECGSRGSSPRRSSCCCRLQPGICPRVRRSSAAHAGLPDRPLVPVAVRLRRVAPTLMSSPPPCSPPF